MGLGCHLPKESDDFGRMVGKPYLPDCVRVARRSGATFSGATYGRSLCRAQSTAAFAAG